MIKGYREFESRIEKVVANPASKAARIQAVFDDKLGRISKREILIRCPDISEAMVKKTLKSLLDAGRIRKIGGGPTTAYVKVQ